MIAFYANKLEVKKAAEEMGILHILNEAIHKSFGYTTEAEIMVVDLNIWSFILNINLWK